MNAQDIATICGAFGGGTMVRWLWVRLSNSPKEAAETRRMNLQSDEIIIKRLEAEIERLDRNQKDMLQQIADERRDCDERIRAMQGRIRQLEQEQASLGHISKNVADGPLRSVYRPDPSDRDDDLIAKLDRATASKPRRRR